MSKRESIQDSSFPSILVKPDFSLKYIKRNIPISKKTTTKEGKRDYQRLYMRMIRNEKRGAIKKR